MTIKEHTYFVVHAWMATRLNLSGVRKEIFAIIYGFSQDGTSYFKGSLSYLEELTGSSRKTIQRTLDNLVEENLIIRSTFLDFNNTVRNQYKVALGTVMTAMGGGQNDHGGVVKMTTQYNIDNTILENSVYDFTEIFKKSISKHEKDLIQKDARFNDEDFKYFTEQYLLSRIKKEVRFDRKNQIHADFRQFMLISSRNQIKNHRDGTKTRVGENQSKLDSFLSGLDA